MMQQSVRAQAGVIKQRVDRAAIHAVMIFIVLGMSSSVLGVALPWVERLYHIPHSTTGLLFTGITTGYVASSAAITWLVNQIGLRRVVVLGCTLLTISLLGSALAPIWLLFVLAGFAQGLATGFIGTGVNLHAVRSLNPQAISWLHAGFGIGIAGGAALMSAMISAGIPWWCGYLTMAAVVCVLTCLLCLIYWPPATPRFQNALPHQTNLIFDGHRGVAWLLGGLIALCAIESVTGAWAYSVLLGRGLTAQTAGTGVTMYWVTFTISRLLLGLLITVFGPLRIMRGCAWILLAGILIFAYANQTLGSLIGITIAGAAVAPLFPLILAQTAVWLGPERAGHLTGAYSIINSLSQALLSSIAGVVAAQWGTGAIAGYLIGVGTILLVLIEMTQFRVRMLYSGWKARTTDL